jgi:hypothetical protein
VKAADALGRLHRSVIAPAIDRGPFRAARIDFHSQEECRHQRCPQAPDERREGPQSATASSVAMRPATRVRSSIFILRRRSFLLVPDHRQSACAFWVKCRQQMDAPFAPEPDGAGSLGPGKKAMLGDHVTALSKMSFPSGARAERDHADENNRDGEPGHLRPVSSRPQIRSASQNIISQSITSATGDFKRERLTVRSFRDPLPPCT